MVKSCKSCHKNILKHHKFTVCTFCNKPYHYACVGISRNDIIDELTYTCLLCNEGIFAFNSIIDDDEFIGVINNSKFDINMLSNMTFNAFEIKENGGFGLLDDIDPDDNFFAENVAQLNISDCKYYEEDKFSEIATDFNNDTISLFHMNIRSCNKNLPQLLSYFHVLNYTFNVIGLTETWAKEENVDQHNIQSYEHYYINRNNRKGGGVSLHIHNSLASIERPDLNTIHECIELVCAEISKEKSGLDKNAVIMVTYRPPNTAVEEYVRMLQDRITKVIKEKKLLYIMGDMNINLLNASSHLPTNDFINTMYANYLFPLISKPTRITEHSATLIDNIYTNNIAHYNAYCKQGLLITDISDHLPIFHMVKTKQVTKPTSYITKRLITEERKLSFIQSVSDEDWNQILNCRDAQIAYSMFSAKLCKLYDKAFPIRKTKIHAKSCKKPWITKSIEKSIKTKNKLYRKSCRYPNDSNKKSYKLYRNKLNHVLRHAEKTYYQVILEQNKNNASKTWSVIKGIVNKNKSVIRNASFKHGNRTITDSTTIANRFNEYFTNVGPKLAQSIPTHDINAISYLKGKYSASFFINPVVSQEVINIIKIMPDKSPGHDDLRVSMIKLIVDSIANPLTHICNLSFITGIVPNELKLAKVIPIYKKEDSMLFSNYRPISVLPLFSKVLERLMYNRLMNYLSSKKILYKYQFGFREHYGTHLALILLEEKISKAIDEGQYTIGLFLDLSKAFDTIDHSILLSKLEHYGIRGLSLQWFSSYLKDRTQYVAFDNAQSNTLSINCGVPQGSILGPLLFLVYINDLALVSEKMFSILFADDTNSFLSGTNLRVLADTINKELIKFNTWLQVNKLSLNIGKTHYIIFKGKRKSKTHNVDIKLNDVTLKKVNQTKFLGVLVDESLTWKVHIDYTAGKVSKCIGILSKGKAHLKTKTLTMLYYAFAYPYLSYCNHVWGNTCSSYLDKLFTLQKKLVRLIYNASYDANTGKIFSNLKIIKIHDINTLLTAIHMYKYHHGLLPDCINGMFTSNNATHNYSTRHGNHLRIPKHNTNIRRYSLAMSGPKVWNTIPIATQNMSPVMFKQKLKDQILSKYK